MSGAERQRRYLERRLQGAQTDSALKAELAQARARIAELEAKNAELLAEIAATLGAPRRPTREELLARKAQDAARISAQRAAAKAAKLAQAAAERPDADVPTLLAENDSLKQQLKAARTRSRNLWNELHHFKEWHEQGMEKVGGMSFAAMSTIAKVLHPDSRKQATEADIDKAFKALTAWKADNSKARRT